MSKISQSPEYTLLPGKWDKEADIVIVGAGGAAAATALSAYESENIKILILEKAPFSGGASAISGGVIAASQSKLNLQKKYGIMDSQKLHYEDTVKAGENLNNSALMKRLCNEAPNTINWLIDLGFEFEDKLMHVGGHSVPRSHMFVGGGGGMVKTARHLLKKRGIPILLEHEVVDILRESSRMGRVKGVIVNHKGKKIFVKARKAVVMATGGFAANLSMRMKYNPNLNKELGNTSTKYVTGDGIIMGKSVMADTVGMDFIQTIPRTSLKGKLDKPAIETFWKMGQGAIDINRQGKKFVYSLATRAVESDHILKQEKPIYVFYDEKIKSMPSLLTDKQYLQYIQKGRINKFKTIKEFAEKEGINSAALLETIKEHNRDVEAGKDTTFNKPDLKVKIEKPPFYAIPSWTAVHYTMGGLVINDKTQVIDIWGNTIPGFYAVGEVTGGIHGSCRLGSNSLTEIWVFGRIAGKMVSGEKFK